MVYPPYAAPFSDSSTAPVLGTQERAMLTALAQKPGKVVTPEILAKKLGLPRLTPRRADELMAGINEVLGPDTVVDVPRKGWMLTPYTVAPTIKMF